MGPYPPAAPASPAAPVEPVAAAQPTQEAAPSPVQAADTAAVDQHVGALAQEVPAGEELPPVTHNEPILTGGSAGPAVERLCRLLAAAGYASNTVVKGENPPAVLDNSVMADVNRFRAAHDVHEPPELFQGRDVPAADEEGKWVGPHTWQALKDNAAQLAAE